MREKREKKRARLLCSIVVKKHNPFATVGHVKNSYLAILVINMGNVQHAFRSHLRQNVKRFKPDNCITDGEMPEWLTGQA